MFACEFALWSLCVIVVAVVMVALIGSSPDVGVGFAIGSFSGFYAGWRAYRERGAAWMVARAAHHRGKVSGSRRRQRAGVPGSSPRTHRRRVFSCRVGVKHNGGIPWSSLISYGAARNTRNGGELMAEVLCLCCHRNRHLPPPEGGVRCFPCTVHCEGAECELPPDGGDA